MEGVVPVIVPRQTPPKILDTSPPVGTVAPPVWAATKRNAAIQRIVSRVAIVVVVLIAIGSGAWAVQHYGIPKLSSLLASHSSPVATPSPSVTPSPTIVAPLTAQIAANACLQSHVGDTACFRVQFTNTGPAIGNLAIVFVTDPPYSNWFQHHFGVGMAATDNADGCSVDSVHLQVVCGPVPTGAHIVIHVVGYQANAGTHTYGVRFGDISSGSLSDVNLNPDGTPFIFRWTETIS